MDKGYGILIVSVTIFVLCLVGTASATNWSVDDSGGEDFTGIQDAINNASDGDTIIVYSGVYYENVVVDKSITLKGIGHPRVRGGRIIRSAITLTADGITLVGFNATNSGSLWSDVGIKVTSNNNTITGNVFVNEGLYLSSPYQNTVEDNTVNGKPLVYLENVSDYKVEDAGQIILLNCNNISVENLDLSNTSGGIALWKTENSKISNNTVCNNNFVGISLYDSSNNNTITGNNVSSNVGGIYLSSSSSNAITGNTARNNFVSIRLNESCNNNITGNNASNNNWGGISLSSSSNNNITGNNVSNNNEEGIRISSSSNNNTITGNNVNNNEEGILLYYYSNNNTITGNNVSNNNHGGILLYYYSNNNTITGNNLSSNNWGGIRLDASSNNNTITGNVFVNDGLFAYRPYQNTVGGNTVNDKPLVYLKDVSDCKVENAGQVILINCSNISVENLDLSNASIGVDLLKTRNSRISNNTVCNNWNGIHLYYSNYNNNITGNNLRNNRYGIYLGHSSNNKIYFNNFIHNTYNVKSRGSTNIWNSPLEITYTYDGTTYKSYLGNYWDDYEGTDAEGDGIGNTHYSIDSKSDESDDYPLMKPFEDY